ncbi:MAG: hydrolase family protein [Nocardia sp.]|uniref:SGNH/GDSL hydrolase family protein n=1 Tax=Nocardia sp. TaxID=1821 RepID=UPI0026068CED|nr:SGNH/GDSL hydrolase family protein [Nocardia sp.]MCU1643777.1 hydrolase family protein [Nocardia sp.]
MPTADIASRRSLRRLAAVAAACTTAGIATGTAHGNSPVIEAGTTYVALGSSYAAGPALEPIIDIDCLRSGADYAHLVADRGVTGRHLAPQIDAVTPDARLVTITIGGNDLGYVGALTTLSCRNALGPSACGGAATPATAADLDRVESALAEVVDTVRAKAPGATVMLVDYLPVLDARAETCATVPLAPNQAIALRSTYIGLLEATRRAADSTGATLVRTGGDESQHTACGLQPWVTGFELPNPMAGRGAPYHPNAFGMAAVADSVAAGLSTDFGEQ